MPDPIAPAAPSTPEASPGADPGPVPPAAGSPTPGETPQVDAPPQPAKARDFAALEKAKFQAREAKRKAEAEVSAIKAELEAARAGSTKAQQLEAELAAARAELEEARKDGLKYAVRHGANPDDLVRGYIDGTTPEKQLAVLAEKLKETDASVAKKVEEALAAERAERAKVEEERQKAATERAEAAAIDNFVRTVTADATKCPHLVAEFEEAEIRAAAAQIQAFAKQHNKSYPFEEVRDFLEQRAKALHDQRAERRSKLLAAQSPDGVQGVAPPKGAPASPPAAGNGRRQAGPGTTATPPPKNESRHARIAREREEDLAALRAAAAKDAAARANASRH